MQKISREVNYFLQKLALKFYAVARWPWQACRQLLLWQACNCTLIGSNVIKKLISKSFAILVLSFKAKVLHKKMAAQKREN